VTVELQPMITESKRAAIGDMSRDYNYMCDKCSAHCPLNLRFQPTDASFFPKCFNDGKDAHWVPVV
jgi:epoxyqueuosine reductase QueG